MKTPHSTDRDLLFLRRAIQLANQAEGEGNLPIGAVIVLSGEIIAEGRNTIWSPVFDGTRHAEMEAIRAVPPELWAQSAEMTLYTTLQPCLMCASTILIHHIGRVVFGARDDWGGVDADLTDLPPFFRQALASTRWEGPALPAECDPLYARTRALISQREQERS
jgi:tRNA(adenine34) deaminase